MILWTVLGFVAFGAAFRIESLDRYGPFALVLRSKLLKCDHRRGLDLDASEMQIYFYDFKLGIKHQFPVDKAADSILALRLFNTERQMKFFVPGYHSSTDGNSSNLIRDSFRALNHTYLFILDHSTYTTGDSYIESYEKAVKYVNLIGRAFGRFLTRLLKGRVRAENMHCIGHNLGGQMIGVAGEIFTKNTPETLARITALDPAGPCFHKSNVMNQVRSGLARYVEVYHCNSGELGSASVLGDVDFFANGEGIIQPQCEMSFIRDVIFSARAAKCSHEMCVKYYAETVGHPDWFPAFSCKKQTRGRCGESEQAIAGFWNPGDAKGVYYFSTDNSYV